MKRSLIVGLNSAGFNSSSCILDNGELKFAVEEERVIREKRTRKFPIKGLNLALKEVKGSFNDVSTFAIAWNPATNLETHAVAQSDRARYLGEIFYSVPSNLLRIPGQLTGDYSTQLIQLADGHEIKIVYVNHHISHAASFFISSFEKAAILVVDAFGEKDCTSFFVGNGNKLNRIWSQEFPHSLGAFYSTFTEFCGFTPQSDEWKLMGASSYGDNNRFYHKIRGLVNFIEDGGIELDLSFFNHYQFHRPGRFTEKLPNLLGIPANKPELPCSKDIYDVAAAAQRVMEDIYFHYLNALHKKTGLDSVVLAGGVTLNSVANGKICKNTPFKNIFIPSAPDDGGGCVGAAYYVYNHIENNSRVESPINNYFGPGFSDEEIEQILIKFKLSYRTVKDPGDEGARLICAGKIIGWFQGRLEFGDRALGNRSILADPRREDMKDKVNETVKYRESFRPFAPAILSEYVDEYFEGASDTPYMEKVFPIRADKQKMIPAVTHADGTGRLQTVKIERNKRFFDLINTFYKLTGIPIVLNTSFNLKGEAIVCTPEDAIRTFVTSGLDALVVGNCILEKKV